MGRWNSDAGSRTHVALTFHRISSEFGIGLLTGLDNTIAGRASSCTVDQARRILEVTRATGISFYDDTFESDYATPAQIFSE
jgi:hypothetical protein